MKNQLVMEQLQPEYLDQAVELHRTILPFAFSLETARQRYTAILNDPAHLVLCAREGEQVVGTVTLVRCKALSGNFLVLEDFVVRPGLTGQGIGGRLMDRVDRFVREMDCGYAILVSSAFRTDAHRFYRAHGFTDEVMGFRKVYDQPACCREEEST